MTPNTQAIAQHIPKGNNEFGDDDFNLADELQKKQTQAASQAAHRGPILYAPQAQLPISATPPLAANYGVPPPTNSGQPNSARSVRNYYQ